MRVIPQCLRCRGTMHIGFIADRGHGNVTRVSTWVEGYPEQALLFGLKLRGRANLPCLTLRCADCGYLESYAVNPESA